MPQGLSSGLSSKSRGHRGRLAIFQNTSVFHSAPFLCHGGVGFSEVCLHLHVDLGAIETQANAWGSCVIHVCEWCHRREVIRKKHTCSQCWRKNWIFPYLPSMVVAWLKRALHTSSTISSYHDILDCNVYTTRSHSSTSLWRQNYTTIML